ncbi:MAG: ABC transporter permease, partial [Gemmatimonadaceae bacterium]
MPRRSAFRRFFRLPTPSASRIREEVDTELAFHFEMRTEELVRQGMAPDAAREQARREFGDVGFTARYCRHEDRERVRESNRSEVVHGAFQDVRYACRQLRLNPGFAAIAVLTLALGIGATTAIFGAVDGVLLRPLPYAGADRIVALSDVDLQTGEEDGAVSPGNFLEWEERATSFEAMGALQPNGLDLAGTDGPEAIRSWSVTAGYFRVMGTRPLLGRTLDPGDFVPGRNRVVVISEPLWRSRFGSDPRILERPVVLDGEPWSIVGVMPPEFRYPAGRDMWSPKIFEENERQNRVASYYEAVAKLKPGVTPEAARAELSGIALQLAREYPRSNASMGAALASLAERLTGAVRPALL